MRALAIIPAVLTLLVLALPAKPASHSALQSREHRQVLTLRRDHGTIRFFRNHPVQARTPIGKRAARFAQARIAWVKRELAETRAALQPKPDPAPAATWLVNAFMCIHRYEGSWTANTGNGYFGGLQFGWSEWQRFGGRYAARADLASPSQQIAAGIAYHGVSGFSPWPNTARACGLL